MNLLPRSPLPRAAALVALALVGARCTDDAGDPAAASAPRAGRQLQISDALHSGGTSGFYWLPPVVPRAAHRGDFVPTLDPRVRIDELLPGGGVARTLATFTRTSGPGGERVRVHEEHGRGDPDDRDGDGDDAGYYYVRWDTHCAALSPAATYRIRVLVPAAGGATRELGFADVDVVRDARQVRGVDRDSFVPLVAGSTLRIKFRIDRPAVDRDGDGVTDDRDDCPDRANPDQRDADRDGRGDACECDGVTCPAADACHLAGACDGRTGACTSPAAPDGVACPLAHGAGQCAAGACAVASCAAGFADCNAAPADGCERSTRMLADCGACGVACAGAPHASPTCATGACALTCDAGWADCDGSPANGCELDVSADPAHCGACDVACADGRACVAGACSATACVAGRGNCDGAEANGCEAALAGDVRHCGACGNACAAPHGTPSCTGGACGVAACDPGHTDCNAVAADGCEVSTAADPAHCGACGRACAVAHATPLCADGACAVGACDAGWADVNGLAADGCEVDLSADPAHCGAVGRACSVAHGAAGCVAGACVVARCDAGFADCDGAVGDGCEVNTAADPAHCGACANACRGGANAATVCDAGRCGLACAAGFANCNGFLTDGCEADLAASSRHCGACGNACADGRTCAAGACTTVVCAPGRADCDGAEANGCEVSTAADPANCGACGRACAFPHSVPECAAGGCGFTACEPGYADCNGAQADGCEVALGGDDHCGGCGVACGDRTGCVAGACAPRVFTVTHGGDGGPGSLRAALEGVNASPRGGDVVFALDSRTTPAITVTSNLPAVTRPVFIDGRTARAAGGPVLTLTATAFTGTWDAFHGILVQGAPVTIRALAITGNNYVAVEVHDSAAVLLQDVHAEGASGTRYDPAVAFSVTNSREVQVVDCSAVRYPAGIQLSTVLGARVDGNDLRGVYNRGTFAGHDYAIQLSQVGPSPAPAGLGVSVRNNLFSENSYGHVSLSRVNPLAISGVPSTRANVILERSLGFGTANTNPLYLSNCARIVTVEQLDLSRPPGPHVSDAREAGIDSDLCRLSVDRVVARGRSTGLSIRYNALVPEASTVTCSDVTGGSRGIWLHLGRVTQSAFDVGGLGLFTGGPNPIDASYNFWGDASGPSNLGGSGGRYDGDVDATPWLTARPACAP